MNSLLEVCCGSYEDGLTAAKAKVKRIELNSALYLGGLTPSLATLIKLKETTDLQIICMVRPRAGGFHYSLEDKEIMLEDAQLLLQNGADGIAFGFLNENFTVDREMTEKMIRLTHKFKKEAVFHRAIDVVNNIDESIRTLIDLRCNRILTSGTYETAFEGKEILKKALERYGTEIEFVMGSGINEKNVRKLIDYTGIHQVHSSCKSYLEDPTTSNNGVSYKYLKNNLYDIVDLNKVNKILNVIE